MALGLFFKDAFVFVFGVISALNLSLRAVFVCVLRALLLGLLSLRKPVDRGKQGGTNWVLWQQFLFFFFSFVALILFRNCLFPSNCLSQQGGLVGKHGLELSPDHFVFLRTNSFANGLIDVFPGHLKPALHSLFENHCSAFVQDRWMQTPALN